jgi:hypothetical protein|tara:strand:+ start:4248 stop:4802 length:555 start_codon:yes stop_codon:yes gene_type:complete
MSQNELELQSTDPAPWRDEVWDSDDDLGRLSGSDEDRDTHTHRDNTFSESKEKHDEYDAELEADINDVLGTPVDSNWKKMIAASNVRPSDISEFLWWREIVLKWRLAGKVICFALFTVGMWLFVNMAAWDPNTSEPTSPMQNRYFNRTDPSNSTHFNLGPDPSNSTHFNLTPDLLNSTVTNSSG